MSLRIFLRLISDERGSAIVEAAFVYPLVVLLIAGVMGLSLRILDETQADAERHREEARQALEPSLLSVENVLRGVWLADE